MNDELKTYLEWRFRTNNHAKYLRYQEEWINNIPNDQLWYYIIEREHLRGKGIYTI